MWQVLKSVILFHHFPMECCMLCGWPRLSLRCCPFHRSNLLCCGIFSHWIKSNQMNTGLDFTAFHCKWFIASNNNRCAHCRRLWRWAMRPNPVCYKSGKRVAMSFECAACAWMLQCNSILWLVELVQCTLQLISAFCMTIWNSSATYAHALFHVYQSE